jgi:hypothetical protein
MIIITEGVSLSLIVSSPRPKQRGASLLNGPPRSIPPGIDGDSEGGSTARVWRRSAEPPCQMVEGKGFERPHAHSVAHMRAGEWTSPASRWPTVPTIRNRATRRNRFEPAPGDSKTTGSRHQASPPPRLGPIVNASGEGQVIPGVN